MPDPGFSQADGPLIFDVGANVGDHAEKFLEKGARVVCFDPQPSCVEALQERFGGNGRVRVVPKGVGPQEGSLEMSVCSEASIVSTFSEEWKQGRFRTYNWDRKVTVPITTLDAAIREYGRPDYCKIDVEGFELEALRGLSGTVGVLSYEFTFEGRERAVACLRRLAALGFTRFNVSMGEATPFYSAEWLGAREMEALLLDLRHPACWGDIYAAGDFPLRPAVAKFLPGAPDRQAILTDLPLSLESRGLWWRGRPLHVFFGADTFHPEGVNIQPPGACCVPGQPPPDIVAEIREFRFAMNCIDVLEMHQALQQFPRDVALAILISWFSWLKVGGTLRVTVPDAQACARVLADESAPLKQRLQATRGLAGAQDRASTSHRDVWFPERLRVTLEALGFEVVSVNTVILAGVPSLDVVARKPKVVPLDSLLKAADALLWDCLLAPGEAPLHQAWRTRLQGLFGKSPAGPYAP